MISVIALTVHFPPIAPGRPDRAGVSPHLPGYLVLVVFPLVTPQSGPHSPATTWTGYRTQPAPLPPSCCSWPGRHPYQTVPCRTPAGPSCGIDPAPTIHGRAVLRRSGSADE